MNDAVLQVSWTDDQVIIAASGGGERLALGDVPSSLAGACEAWAAGVGAVEITAPAGLVALGADGAVLRYVAGQQPDTSPDAGWLTGRLPGGAADWVAAVGSAPAASWMLAKLSWLHRSDDAAWAAMRSALTPRAWLTQQLTGLATTSAADAISTGAWAVDEGWRFDLLAIVDSQREWSEFLPQVVPDGTPLGEWRGLAVRAGR